MSPFFDAQGSGAWDPEEQHSGTTLEPHLHLAMLAWDFERERFWSVPCDFFDVWVGASPSDARHAARVDPETGTWISSPPL